jgi:hypothetical protein
LRKRVTGGLSHQSRARFNGVYLDALSGQSHANVGYGHVDIRPLALLKPASAGGAISAGAHQLPTRCSTSSAADPRSEAATLRWAAEDRGPRRAIRGRRQWGWRRRLLQREHVGRLSRAGISPDRTVVVRLMALAVPALIGVVVDRIVPADDGRLLKVMAVVMVAIIGYSTIATFLRACVAPAAQPP